ncbi:MAG: WhiB family transcriptional regulator [Sediminibacterium sp.]
MYKFDEEPECLNMDTNLFFDKYEENSKVANAVDKLCLRCPVIRQCLAYGVSNQEWGVWGGVYLEQGKISKEFNINKTPDDWFNVWQAATHN